ncbi:MAG: lactate racemase domain-containing protein, partial [Desulfobacterales bacterium]|nr:lactate racemase domain-containing protein [Desulfobacterales bacterium]
MKSSEMNYPGMYRICQTVEAPRVADIEKTVAEELEAAAIGSRITPGDRIAVTAGSRGIAGIDRILKTVVAVLKQHGASPFLIPAMGSHGGGTAEGQLKVLESLNITEERMGAPILSSMDTVRIGTSSFGFPVYADAHAAGADGIVVVNRIKPHTEFEGPVESGLMKMMAIGMGKHKGCIQVHRQTVNYGYSKVIPDIGAVHLDKLPVICGLGIVENLYDDTALIKAVPPESFREEEAVLLTKAKTLMARLPFADIDVLIIDEMGKNISGTGMDTNVIGRIMFVGEDEPEKPRITRIVVLGLTPESHGNAIGIGLADYTTRALTDSLDLDAMATNGIAAMTPEKARLPIALASDRDAVDAALNTIGEVAPENARIVHIKNTLELSEM